MTLTIDDIRSDSKLGFKFVTGGFQQPNPYWARVQRRRSDGRPGSEYVWRGPRRRTPEQAAQDYVDHVNGNPVAAARHVVRSRRATEGWFDVMRVDGDEFIDTPPKSSTAVAKSKVTTRLARERDFMLTKRFEKAVHNLPPNCVAEAKASSALSALQYGTGQVLVKRALRGLQDWPAYLLVPDEPHPDHRKAVEELGVKVIVP